MTILHGAEEVIAAAASDSALDGTGRDGADDEISSSSEDCCDGRSGDGRGENRGSAGMLLKANAVAGKERRRHVRFIVLLDCGWIQKVIVKNECQGRLAEHIMYVEANAAIATYC